MRLPLAAILVYLTLLSNPTAYQLLNTPSANTSSADHTHGWLEKRIKTSTLDAVFQLGKHNRWSRVIFISDLDITRGEAESTHLTLSHCNCQCSNFDRYIPHFHEVVNVILWCRSTAGVAIINASRCRPGEHCAFVRPLYNWFVITSDWPSVRAEVMGAVDPTDRVGALLLPAQSNPSRADMVECQAVCRGVPSWQWSGEVDLHQGSLTDGHWPYLPGLFTHFNGRHVVVVSTEARPYQFYKVVEGQAHFWGTTTNLVDLLSTKLNFTYSYVKSVDTSYGSIDKAGRWRGMVGMLLRRESDLIAADLSITLLRETVLDFTASFLETNSGVLLRLKTNTYSYFLKPFSLYTWIVYGSVVFLAGLVLGAVYKGVPTPTEGNLGTLQWNRLKRISFGLVYTFGAVFSQGSPIRMETCSSRLLTAPLWVGVTIMISTYASNLVASLAIKSIQYPFTTLEAMARQDDYAPLLTAASGPLRDIWKKVTNDTLVSSNKVAIPKMMEGRHALMGSTPAKLAEAHAQGHCDVVRIVGATYFSTGLGFALPDRSPFTAHISKIILKAKQANLVEKWYKYYSPAKPCPSPQRPHAGSSVVTLANVLYVFLILVFGLGVSLTTFIIEVASRIQSPNP